MVLDECGPSAYHVRMLEGLNFPSVEDIVVTRLGHFSDKVVIVDGQFGCGKTMLSPIIAALDRAEILTYAYELEYICAYSYLGKISPDAARNFIQIQTDLRIYNTMMSREINFRPSDISSVFRDIHPWRYLLRLFGMADEHIPEKLKALRPILNLTTHNLTPFCEPLFSSLGERLVLIQVVRHPLYMLKQQTLNMERLLADVRDFTVYFSYEGRLLPYYVYDIRDVFIKANAVDKSIYAMQHLFKRAEDVKTDFMRRLGAKIITIPFESFVLGPDRYLREVALALETTITPSTRRAMRRQNVPREKISAGIPLPIYKHYGWQPPQPGLTERAELERRRNDCFRVASPEALRILDKISQEYEESYGKDVFK